MSDHTLRVKIEAKNASIKKELEQIVRSMDGIEMQPYGDQRPPDLLIFELGDDFQKEFQLLQDFLRSRAVCEIVVVSRIMDPEVLLQAMRTGIKEFLSIPLVEREVRQALQAVAMRQQESGTCRSVKSGQIIHVIGSKGGVGATTVAVNLAVCLAERNKSASVSLIDMKTVFGEIPLFLAVKPSYDWGEVTKNISRLDPTFLMNILCKHPSGIHILPSPAHMNGHPRVTSEVMQRLLNVMKSTFDYVVIDGGQSLDEAFLKSVEMSDQILIVSLLNLPCMSNTSRLLKSLIHQGVLSKDRTRLVINRYVKKSDISREDAEQSVNMKIFWDIPDDFKTTMTAINEGKTLREIALKAAVTKNLEAMAEALVGGEEGQQVKKRGFWRR